MLLHVNLSHNRITTVSGLATCGMLTFLDLSSNSIDETPDLSSLVRKCPGVVVTHHHSSFLLVVVAARHTPAGNSSPPR